jgi:hypothetical protein
MRTGTHENVFDDSDAGTVPVKLLEHRSMTLLAHRIGNAVTHFDDDHLCETNTVTHKRVDKLPNHDGRLPVSRFAFIEMALRTCSSAVHHSVRRTMHTRSPGRAAPHCHSRQRGEVVQCRRDAAGQPVVAHCQQPARPTAQTAQYTLTTTIRLSSRRGPNQHAA